MKEHTVTTYEFKELSDKAKEKVLQDLSDISTDYDWYDFTIDYWKERLEQIGFSEAVINFSGFSSQGDGASFTAICDISKIAYHLVYCKGPKDYRFLNKMHICGEKGLVSVNIVRDSFNYVHALTCSVRPYEYFLPTNAKLEKLTDDITEAIEELRLQLCYEIYESLETEYNYLCSEEVIIETIEANEYEFTVDGKMFTL